MTIATTSKPTSDTFFEQSCITFEAAFDSPPQAFIDSVDATAPGFGHRIVKTEFEHVYNRRVLDLKNRELCINVSSAALDGTGSGAVRMHISAALRHGATRAETTEVQMQVGMAAGLPASLSALQVARETFDAMDTTTPV